MERNPSFGQSLDATIVKAIRDYRQHNPKADDGRLVEHLVFHYAGHVRSRNHAYELIDAFNAKFGAGARG